MTAKKTILCVDDEQRLSIHKLTLETRGYRVLACHNGADAMKLIARRSVDLVLSNLELPDMSSSALANQVKAHAPETPVVLLSSRQRVIHSCAPADLLLREGAYSPADLLEQIRLLLIKRRGPRRMATPPVGRQQRPESSGASFPAA
jgi:two-component system response regulator CpxR